ncbi:MAG: glycosyltransferase family 9 protein [Candidatus Melainabacteria bacterium]|nr:glycosyltransferase family 9 protein [Candidatus Melainabacteria bacterium]
MSLQPLPKKILTINFGGIGDEILFLPTLLEVKKLLPDSRISLLLEPRSKSVKEVTDLVDEVLPFDIKKRPLLPSDYLKLLSLTRQGKYDLVISSGSSPMVAMLLFASGIPVRIGYDAGSPVKCLLTHPVKLNKEQYAGNMYHDLSRGLRAYLDEHHKGHTVRTSDGDGMLQIPRVTIDRAAAARMQEALSTEERLLKKRLSLAPTGGASRPAEDEQDEPVQRILIHPGTSRLAVQKGIIKTWDSQNWLTLIRSLLAQKSLSKPIEIILAGGPDDEEVMKDLMQALGSEADKLINFYGKTRSLADLAALIEITDLFICVDSAPMHVAVGLDKKVVALFGPTDPAKLIPRQKNFCALSDNAATTRSLLDGLGVRLLPDTVVQSSLDLLRQG